MSIMFCPYRPNRSLINSPGRTIPSTLMYCCVSYSRLGYLPDPWDASGFAGIRPVAQISTIL